MDKFVTWTVATTAAIGLTVNALPKLVNIAASPSDLKRGLMLLGVSVGAGAAAKHKFVQDPLPCTYVRFRPKVVTKLAQVAPPPETTRARKPGLP